MALCMKCGTVLNDADMGNHVCDPNDVPAVGMQKKPTTTESGIPLNSDQSDTISLTEGVESIEVVEL